MTRPTVLHNYTDVRDDEETNSLRLGSFVDQSGRNLTLVQTEVFQPSSGNHSVHRSPSVERATSPTRSRLQGAPSLLVKEGEGDPGLAKLAPKVILHTPSGATTNVANEVVYEEIDDSLERAATTTTSLDAEQDRSSGPRRQDTMGDTIAQTGFENVSKTSNDLLLAGVNTPQSDEYSLKLKELMELYTNLQNRVIDMEKSKTSQAQEITSLKRRVRRLEKKGGSRTHKLKRLYKVGLSAKVESSKESLGEEDASKQGRIDDIDANEDIYLVNVHRDEDRFGVNNLEGDEVVVETEVASKDVNLSIDEVTLAQALAALKITVASTRPKAKWLVIHEEEQASTPTVSSQQPSQVKVQDKGKGIMVEEPLKMKKKDQVSFDEQEAKRLQAEFDEEDRLAREKDEANVALTEEWNDIQAKIDVDYQLAQRLQAQEQEELTDEEKARLF
ncbi:hypothetical protein Tco_1237963 [Tanacetum coccineum]